MAIILLAALFGIVPHQRRPMGVMVGMLATLMLGAFLFIYPGYLAVLVRRVYIPVIIFLTGLFSLAICRVLGFIWQAERKDAHAARQTRPGFSVLRGVPGKGVALLGLLGMLWMSGRHLVTDYREFQEIKYSMIGGFNIAFDDQQPAILQSPEHRCQSVLYLYEIPLYLFLSHDVYACDAVYYRALKGTPEETTWVLDNQHIRHVVTFNPLVNFATARDGGIWLLPGERLELHTVGAKPLDHLELYFDNRGSIVLAVGSRHGPGVSVSG